MSRSLNASSHGIGLSVCAQIAESLNGSLTCRSKLRKGTTITFEFGAKRVSNQKLLDKLIKKFKDKVREEREE